MKLNYITIQVRDIHQSIYFYQQLVGLKLVRQFPIPHGEIAFLQHDENETMLELIASEQENKVSVNGMVMSYQTSHSLEELRNIAIALGYHPSKIMTHPTKPTYFRVNDPDGIVVEFANH